MCKRIRKYIRKLIRSNRKTFKNKLCAIALLSLGMFAAIICNRSIISRLPESREM